MASKNKKKMFVKLKTAKGKLVPYVDPTENSSIDLAKWPTASTVTIEDYISTSRM